MSITCVVQFTIDLLLMSDVSFEFYEEDDPIIK